MPLNEYITPSGDRLCIGTIIFASYKKGPPWPAMIRSFVLSKKKTVAYYKFLPIYEGDYSFSHDLKSVQLYKPDMEHPADADKDLQQAYAKAREYYGFNIEQATELFRSPPARPVKTKEKVEEESKARKQKSTLKSEDNYNDKEVDGESDLECDEFDSAERVEDNNEFDLLYSVLDNEKTDDASPPKRIRRLYTNKVIFSKAPRTKIKSKDQVILVQNPHGTGLWPALSSSVPDRKGFATYELFPRASTGKWRGDRQQQQAELLRAANTEVFEFDDKKLNAMIDYVKQRSKKLYDALVDVRTYLQDNHRFELESQVSTKFEDSDVYVKLDKKKSADEPTASALAFDELHLTASTGTKLLTRNHKSLIHKLPKGQMQEQRLLQDKFALTRLDPNQKPTWLFNHRIYTPHYELKFADLTNQKVRDHFEYIWTKTIKCRLHELFLKNLNPKRPYYPSSYRISACTGGLVSNEDADKTIQEYLNWIDLTTKLPRMSIINKFRYAMEVMVKETCVLMLCEKRQYTREQAEKFLLDGQDHAFAVERGYRIDALHKCVVEEPAAKSQESSN